MRPNARLWTTCAAMAAIALGCWACTSILGDFSSNAGDASVESDSSTEGSLGDAPELDAPQDGNADVVVPLNDGGPGTPVRSVRADLA